MTISLKTDFITICSSLLGIVIISLYFLVNGLAENYENRFIEQAKENKMQVLSHLMTILENEKIMKNGGNAAFQQHLRSHGISQNVSLQEKYNKYNFTYYEYNLFCNEQQLYKYLNKLIVNTAYDYLRIKKKAYKDRTIKQQKLIKHKPNKENIYKNIIKYYANSESKNKQLILEFAFLFIENDKTFSETEVAQKLKVTRQAINKRKHKIFALIRQDTQNIC